eukprot:tig00021037_g17450.t1
MCRAPKQTRKSASVSVVEFACYILRLPFPHYAAVTAATAALQFGEFKTSAGAWAHEHYCSRGLLRGGRGRRGLGLARGRCASQQPAPVAVAAAEPPPPLYHLRWRSASPFAAGQVVHVAALATHAANPLPGVWFARLVQMVDLPSGECESRFVVLKRFGNAWAPSGEGGPNEWGAPSALFPVEYEGRNGTVEIRNGPERVMELLGLPSTSAPLGKPSAPVGTNGRTVRLAEAVPSRSDDYNAHHIDKGCDCSVAARRACP